MRTLKPLLVALFLLSISPSILAQTPQTEIRCVLEHLADALGKKLVMVGVHRGETADCDVPTRDTLRQLVLQKRLKVWENEEFLLVAGSDQLLSSVRLEVYMGEPELVSKAFEFFRGVAGNVSCRARPRSIVLEGPAQEVGECLEVLAEIQRPSEDIDVRWQIVSLASSFVPEAAQWWKEGQQNNEVSIDNPFAVCCPGRRWLDRAVDAHMENGQTLLRAGEPFSIRLEYLNLRQQSVEILPYFKSEGSLELDIRLALKDWSANTVMRIRGGEPILCLLSPEANRFLLIDIQRRQRTPWFRPSGRSAPTRQTRKSGV